MAPLRSLATALAIASASAQVNVQINTQVLAGSINQQRFLSVGWEMDAMLGYVSVLNDTRYQTIASHLAPATVRVGGITADWVRYDLSSSEGAQSANSTASPVACSLGGWPNSDRNLTFTDFKKLVSYFKGAGIGLMFDLNILYGKDCNTTKPNCPPSEAWCWDWCSGPWDSSNARAFLQAIHDEAGLYVPGATSGLVSFECGNELVTHEFANTTIVDMQTLAGIIQDVWSDVPPSQRPPLYGPSTDMCNDPLQLGIMDYISVPGIAGFTYHAYPGQNGAGVYNLTNILLNSTWLRTGILTGSNSDLCLNAWNQGPRDKGLEIWITEASSSYAWQLPPPAQNSFIEGFFALAQWGQYAATGVQGVARWSWSEPTPFALIAQNWTRAGSGGFAGGWDVAAEYFLTIAFKNLVGPGVLAVSGDDASDALVYAYCGLLADGWLHQPDGSVVVTAVNPSETAITLDLSTATGATLATTPRYEYVFTAPGGDLSSTTPVLNGNEGAPLRIGEDGSLPPMQPVEVPEGGAAALTLPPRSQAFFVLYAANAQACLGQRK